MEHLDTTDIRILKLLQQDSDITTGDLAKKICLSYSPVFKRIQRLEKLGYIKKYVAILDSDKLNKSLIVFCNIRLKEHTKEIGNKFVSEIKSIQEVTDCYNISGDYDFLLKIYVEDMKHYQDFVFNKLGSIKNIGNAHSTFVMGEIKHSYAIPL